MSKRTSLLRINLSLSLLVLAVAAVLQVATADTFVAKRSVAYFSLSAPQTDTTRSCPSYAFPEPYCPKTYTIVESWNATSSGGLNEAFYAYTCETMTLCKSV